MPVLTIDRIRIDVEVPDWKAAVRAAGELLVNTGAAENRYIDAMIRMTEELGPYIVVTPGVAIPHARPEEGALEVGFAAVKLATPVEFGNQYNDPVYLVLGFCSPEPDAHIDLLTQIAISLEKEGILEAIKAASEPQEIAALFNN